MIEIIPGSAAFPGISDLLHEVEKVVEAEELEQRMERVRLHLSDLLIIFHQAEQWLDSVALL
jgi:CCR4-NOT transcriptional regulation complex NOT5 subunit